MSDSRLSKWVQIAEITSAVAVVISLIYVGYEIRENTIASRAQAFQEVSYSLADWSMTMATEDNFFLLKGMSNPEELSSEEMGRFLAAWNSFMHKLDSAFVLYESGILDRDQYRAIAQICAATTSSAGSRVWLEEFSQMLTPAFLAHVENGCAVE